MELDEFMQQNPVFACLTPPDRDQVRSQAVLRRLERGEYLAHAGDNWENLFFTAEGVIQAVKESSEGRSFVAASIQAGDLFWGVSFFIPGTPMPVSLKADQPSCVHLWSRARLLPFLIKDGGMAWELSRLMVGRMLRVSEIVEELAFQPVAGRLARLLMDFPGQMEAGPTARSLTLDEMAARIGSTREMVCRFLQRFADEGLIRITRTEFEITDRDRLGVMAQKEKP